MATANPAPVLAGWYVISLRPSGAHGPIRRAAAALGARVLPISTLRLLPLDAGVALDAALACAIVSARRTRLASLLRRRRPAASDAAILKAQDVLDDLQKLLKVSRIG